MTGHFVKYIIALIRVPSRPKVYKFTPAGSDARYAPYSYDVSADGQRFLLLVPPEDSSVPITVVLNWTSALNR